MIQPSSRNSALAKQETSSCLRCVFRRLLTSGQRLLRSTGRTLSFLLESVKRRKIARYTSRALIPKKSSVTQMAHAFWKPRSYRLEKGSRHVSSRAWSVFAPFDCQVAAAHCRRHRYFSLHGSANRASAKRLRDEIGLFDAMLMFYHGLIAFDHVQHRL